MQYSLISHVYVYLLGIFSQCSTNSKLFAGLNFLLSLVVCSQAVSGRQVGDEWALNLKIFFI